MAELAVIVEGVVEEDHLKATGVVLLLTEVEEADMVVEVMTEVVHHSMLAVDAVDLTIGGVVDLQVVAEVASEVLSSSTRMCRLNYPHDLAITHNRPWLTASRLCLRRIRDLCAQAMALGAFP